MTSAKRPSQGGHPALTPRRRRMVQVIEEYLREHGCSPTNREIADGAGPGELLTLGGGCLPGQYHAAVIVGEDAGDLEPQGLAVDLRHLREQAEDLVLTGAVPGQRAQSGVVPGDVIGQGAQKRFEVPAGEGLLRLPQQLGAYVRHRCRCLLRRSPPRPARAGASIWAGLTTGLEG